MSVSESPIIMMTAHKSWTEASDDTRTKRKSGVATKPASVPIDGKDKAKYLDR